MIVMSDDWMYAGIGLGAVYLITQLTKPVTGLVSETGSAAGSVITSTGKLATDLIKGVDTQIIQPAFAPINLPDTPSGAPKAAVNALGVVTFPSLQVGTAAVDAIRSIFNVATPATNKPLSSAAAAVTPTAAPYNTLFNTSLPSGQTSVVFKDTTAVNTSSPLPSKSPTLQQVSNQVQQSFGVKSTEVVNGITIPVTHNTAQNVNNALRAAKGLQPI